jgi:hypothetical protein
MSFLSFLNSSVNTPLEHVSSEAGICHLPTASAWVWSQVRLCGIYGVQIGSGAVFLQVLQFPLSILIPPVSAYSLIMLSLTLCSHTTDSIVKWRTNCNKRSGGCTNQIQSWCSLRYSMIAANDKCCFSYSVNLFVITCFSFYLSWLKHFVAPWLSNCFNCLLIPLYHTFCIAVV